MIPPDVCILHTPLAQSYPAPVSEAKQTNVALHKTQYSWRIKTMQGAILSYV